MNRLTKWRRKQRTLQGGGIAAFGFGIELPTRGKSERDVVRELVIRLAERRAVRDPNCFERIFNVAESVATIRPWLTQAMTDLPEPAAAAPYVDAMREACNRFMTSVEGIVTHRDVIAAYERLRETLRVNLLALASAYDLPEARDLARRIADRTDAMLY